MTTLIIGYGHIGKALELILRDYAPDILDKERRFVGEKFDIIHICFGYDENFVSEVKRYQELFKPKYTVIHSTVPVGTSRELNAIHSPVVGIHPHLAESIKTFKKFLGGKGASGVADYFRRAGCNVYLFDDQETTELAKLSQTTFYAMTIEYAKMLKRICDEKNLSFTEVYTTFVVDYNRGYEELGMPEIKIPNLVPIMKEQGGHCTIPNCDLWTNDFTEFIKAMNEKGGLDEVSKLEVSHLSGTHNNKHHESDENRR